MEELLRRLVLTVITKSQDELLIVDSILTGKTQFQVKLVGTDGDTLPQSIVWMRTAYGYSNAFPITWNTPGQYNKAVITHSNEDSDFDNVFTEIDLGEVKTCKAGEQIGFKQFDLNWKVVTEDDRTDNERTSSDETEEKGD